MAVAPVTVIRVHPLLERSMLDDGLSSTSFQVHSGPDDKKKKARVLRNRAINYTKRYTYFIGRGCPSCIIIRILHYFASPEHA